MAERLVHQVRATRRRRPGLRQLVERARLIVGDERHRLAAGAGLGQLRGGGLERLVPAHGLPCALHLEHRPAHAIGVVQALQPGLPACAHAAAVHGVRGIALDLDGAPLARLHQDAAARGAFAAGAGVPVGHARQDVLRRDEVRNQLLRRLRASRDADAAQTHELEEIPAIERHGIRHGLPSDDTPGNPSAPGAGSRGAARDDT